MTIPPEDPRPTGGCLCGRIRYRLARVSTDVGHCHCRLCQRSSGAAFLTWATLQRREVTVTTGEPTWYRSTPGASRGFCPTCGTQLFFVQGAEPPRLPPAEAVDETADVDITVASLDEPDAFVPTRNIWVGTRRACLHGFDTTLPDHPDEGPNPD